MQKDKKTALSLALSLAVLFGIGFLISPNLQRQQLEQQQEAILKRIETGNNVVKLPETNKKIMITDYEQPDNVDTIPIPVSLKLAESEVEMETETFEPSQSNPSEVAGIGVLTIEKIDAKLPVTAGVTDAQLKVSEGWVTQTSHIGNEGNAVIAGHRSYTYGRHFNRLGELESGDEIRYTPVDGEEMLFIVSEILTVEPGDPAVFAAPPENTAQLTLYTCTPIKTATHRLLVRALRAQ